MQEYIYNIGFLFSKIALQFSNKVALKYSDGIEVTYIELERNANRLANYFISKGLKKGDVIGIFNNKSPLGYACMLAALKTGLIYTNLDPSSPYPRIKKIVERCVPKMLIFDLPSKMIEETLELNIPTIFFFKDFEQQLENFKTCLPDVTKQVTAADAAYIMFTSGSTGFPKGAVITHANIINFIDWGRATYNISTIDVCTNANPIYFDNSVFDFYVTLFSGAQLVPLTNDITHDPFKLVKAVAETSCTSWFSVPSLLVYLLTTKALQANSLPAIKRFIFGGEGFPKTKLKKLFDSYSNQARLYNVYGPTECTCICSSYEITSVDFIDMNNFAPLGNLAPNFDYVLINPDETGKFGELGLKGPNVGAGYYNDLERTQKSFIQNPYNQYYNEIIYKTGDLVYVNDIGYLLFKGRIDNQIKHMGYRIELEEIESVLNTIAVVKEAAVIYDRINENFGQIVAFVATSGILDDSEILMRLKELLPEYMIPRKILTFEHLPKNQNGKIDKIELINLWKNNG